MVKINILDVLIIMHLKYYILIGILFCFGIWVLIAMVVIYLVYAHYRYRHVTLTFQLHVREGMP